MLPIAQTAMQHFKLSREATKTRDETSGHNILRDIQSFLQKVFLDTDKNGDFSLIKPSTHLYTVGHEKEMDHFFEPQFYPSTIMTNAKKFVNSIFQRLLNLFLKTRFLKILTKIPLNPEKGKRKMTTIRQRCLTKCCLMLLMKFMSQKKLLVMIVESLKVFTNKSSYTLFESLV